LTAYGMNAPVLAMVGQFPSNDIDRGHGHLHEIPDQLGLMRHFTKAVARIRAPQEAPHLVHDLIRPSISGRQRPAGLEGSVYVWGRAAPVELMPEPAESDPIPIDEDAAEKAAKILGQARRVLVVLGGGAQDASEEVRQ